MGDGEDDKRSLGSSVTAQYVGRLGGGMSTAEYVEAFDRILERLRADAQHANLEMTADATDDDVKTKIALESAQEYLAFVQLFGKLDDLLTRAAKRMDKLRAEQAEDGVTSASPISKKLVN